MAAALCPLPACRTPLESAVDRLGRVELRCPACERRKAGRCLDCPRPVQGARWRCDRCRRRHLAALAKAKARAQSEHLASYTAQQLARKDRGLCVDCGTPVQRRCWRCPGCRVVALHRRDAAYRERHRAELAASERERYRRNPALRDRRNAEKRAWRRANPTKVALQKRRNRLRRTNGYATREKFVAYQAAYRAERREERAAAERARYRRLHPPPTPVCRECGGVVPWDGKFRPRQYCPAHEPAWRRTRDQRRAERRTATSPVEVAA